jgi:hypothetical protein
VLTKPIFIVGHPRSGTSLVRSLVERSDQIWTIGREGKPIWERHLHPSRKGWHSNALGTQDATPELASAITADLTAACRRPGAEWTVADKIDFLHFMSAQGVRPYYYDVPLAVLREHFPGEPPQGPPTTPDGEELDEITPFGCGWSRRASSRASASRSCARSSPTPSTFSWSATRAPASPR